MKEWAESIPAASSLGFVKSSTPGYLEIDWNNPHQVDKGITRYTITAIQGHQDPDQEEDHPLCSGTSI